MQQERQDISQQPQQTFGVQQPFQNYSGAQIQNNFSSLPNASSYMFNRTAREQTMNDPIDNDMALKTLYSNQKFQPSFENPAASINEEQKSNQLISQYNQQQQPQDRLNTYQYSYSPNEVNVYEQDLSEQKFNQQIPNSTLPPLAQIPPRGFIQEPAYSTHVRSYSIERPPVPVVPSTAPPKLATQLPSPYKPPQQPPLNTENQDYIVYLNNSLRDYQEKCEQYQFQLNKLREFTREQDNIISAKMSLIDTIQSEVNLLRAEYDKVFNDLLQYKDTLRKFYTLYMDQEQFINDLKLNNTDLIIGIDRQGTKNIELMDEVKNLLSDKEMLRFRMQEFQKKQDFDIESIKKQMQQRDDDVSNIRKKLNEVIEAKRRVEEDKEKDHFEIEHLKNRVNQEQKEKEVKIIQFERAMQKEQEEKAKIISELNQKVHDLQIQNNKLLDDSKIYVKELQNLARELKNKEFDYSRLKEQSYNMNKQLDFNSTQTAEMIRKALKDFALRHEKSHLDKRKIPLMIDKFMDVMQENNNRQSKILAMNLWKIKFMLRQKERQIKEMTKDENEAESISSNFRNHSIFLAELGMKAMEYIRLQVAQLSYQVFDTVLTTCNRQKINSLILFVNEVKKMRSWTALKISLDAYYLIKQNLIVFLKQIRNLQKLTSLERKLEINTGEMSNFKVEIRDNMNQLIQKLIREANDSRERDRFDENSNVCFLYKLLAIKKKSKTPQDNKIMKFDEDLLIVLDDKICSALRQEVS
ncbi:hypothetical protein TTHERM_00655350 (macronuclear) [Tetrahymena thermophila SB210]|uniref:Uncharacterized protein n=1 Tax=Tetrahymena thermophila (strain SB210) TaxID=312017 RepID=Q22H17_TETTS|nr:hypothetical protein TTHERM_00655350 [Tetrahymena thermophila SB210]EAR84507.2 hypothetical protein TTHERM_00655350 [Tetrahymena thermophila SB210]|eukprot:XP_001032170.2 hypothetical protein TTHERM_00655350 [Tetrahymena thermophila SB210]